MKVLMFGWEFPPHISGGLGTACYGITQALHTQEVEVLFVIPKLYGDEPSEWISFINASDINFDKNKATDMVFKGKREMPSVRNLKWKIRNMNVESDQQQITIEVPAQLVAYTSPSVNKTSFNIEHWNYRLVDSNEPESINISSASEKHSVVNRKRKERGTYSFSGSYGADLLKEVNNYASIGGEIGESFSFDVIHCHDWMTYQAGIAAKKKSGKPLVVHVHATEFDRAGENVDPYIFAIEQQGMSEADCVITVSLWTKRIAMKRYGIPEEKIIVVHNGVVFKKTIHVFSFPKLGSPIITFLGRITHQKGPYYFVEAAQKVLTEFPEAHFIMAGSGDLLPQIIERVAKLKLSSKFHFTGFLKGDQVDKVWSITDVYVMPSVSEPFGITPLEAIQQGVPVIVSNQSGVAEVMPHAIKVDFWDAQALAGSICSIVRHKSLSTSLKRNSSEHLKQITWDKSARKIKSIYHELHKKK